MQHLSLALAIFAVALAPRIAAAAEPVIAVLYIDNHSGDSAYDVLEKGLADMLVTDLSSQGLTVVERARLQALIDEQALQRTAFFDPKTAVEVGKGLGATHVVSGALAAMKPEIRLDLHLVEVETAKVVVTAKVNGPSEALFDLEQELVKRFVDAFERRFASAPMPQTKVKNVEALLEYSRGIDLADKGELEEAKKRIEKTIRLSPSFGLARKLKDEIAKRIEASRGRRDSIIASNQVTLAKRARAAIANKAPAKRFERLAWRHLELELIAMSIPPLMSNLPLGTAALGQDEALRDAMITWANRARDYIAELDGILASRPGPFWQAKLPEDVARLAKQLEIELRPQSDPSSARLRYAKFLLMGDLGAAPDTRMMIAPPLASRDPVWAKRAWRALAEADALAAKDETKEYQSVRVLDEWAEALWFRNRTDEAVAKWQEILDRFPTSRQFDRFEKKIKQVLGIQPDHTNRDLTRWAKGLATCDDMSFRVGIDTVSYRRVRMLGLKGLEDIVHEVEKACPGDAAPKRTWDYLYAWIGRYYGKHGRCAEFERWMAKSHQAGGSLSDIAGWRKNWTKCPEP